MLVVSFDMARVLGFLEPWIMSNVLASPRKDSGYPYELNTDEAELLGGWMHRKFGFDKTVYFGVTKVCLLHDTAVIKIPIHESYAELTTQEIDYINENFTKDQRQHFPYTVHVGEGIAVQERCILDNARFLDRIKEIRKLEYELGLFDIHEGNVGFSMDTDAIKFIDVQSVELLNAAQSVPNTLEILKRRSGECLKLP
jgi:hypothetical protein